MNECTNDVCGRVERGVSGGVKKLVWWWPKREEFCGMATEKQ